MRTSWLTLNIPFDSDNTNTWQQVYNVLLCEIICFILSSKERRRFFLIGFAINFNIAKTSRGLQALSVTLSIIAC